MVTALAGRRIDPPDAPTPRFPLENVSLVRERIEMALAGQTTSLVCSAACGADLIALQVAGSRRIRRRIVLPFSRAEFRNSSVIDRPGDWGVLFDRILDEVEGQGDIVTLSREPNDPGAYAAGNAAILEEANQISQGITERVRAVVVWDGKPRGTDDLTAAFSEAARRKGYPVLDVSTL